MKRPGEVYVPSTRTFPVELPEPTYQAFDDVLRVNRGGQIYIPGLGQIMLSPVLGGEHVGIREELDGRWLVTFCDLDLGHAGPDRKTFNPFSASPPPEASPT